MSYKNYSNEDLIEAYTTMMEYSGKADNSILSEIDNRGGIESFLQSIEFQKEHKKEINRITNEVYSLSAEISDLNFIKPLIESEIFSKEELENLIEQKFNEHQKILKNSQINQKTIFGSFAGIICGVILSSFFYILLLSSLGRITFYPIIGVYIICYFCIKLITKQTRENVFVFISTLLATILTLIITFLYFKN